MNMKRRRKHYFSSCGGKGKEKICTPTDGKGGRLGIHIYRPEIMSLCHVRREEETGNASFL